MPRFRILSLDGGGIKGAFSASVVATLEEATGRRVVDHFDLISGTSTGGIIAIGLGLGLPAKEIVAFYQQHGPTIFPATSLVQRAEAKLRQLISPKHSHDVLRSALRSVLGDRKFGESKCRLVIPTYDANAGRIFVLKTAHHPRLVFDYDALAVDVALATSAAPTYFKAAPFPAHLGASYVDGGVWANCPALVGLVEAVSFLSVPLEQIDILSIGATSEPFSIAQKLESGVAQWNVGLVDLLFEAQIEAARVQASLLTHGRVRRIDHIARPGDFSLDDATPEKIARMIQLARGVAVKKEHFDDVIARFLNGEQTERFEPCRKCLRKLPTQDEAGS